MLIVTDAMMIDVAENFVGWANSVYKFGCAFINLSNLHGYNALHPIDSISAEEKSEILSHMRNYHGSLTSDSPTFHELAIYFPKVFDKIKSNLERYLEMLSENAPPEHVL